MLLSSKVVVREEEPRVRGISAGPTAVCGAVGVARRGPIGEAVLCTSFEDFYRRFGGFTDHESDLAVAAMGFFANGGSQLWAVRTAHYTDIADPATHTADKAFATLIKAGDPDKNMLQVTGRDPGSYANQIEAEVRAASSGDPDVFNLAIIDDGKVVEVFANLSMNPDHQRYVETIVNNDRTGSLLIRVTDLDSGELRPDNQKVFLVGGDDGLTGLDDTDFVGSEAGKTGLHAFDQVQDLSLLIVPGWATPAVQHAMIAYCESVRSGSVFAIFDPPAGLTAAEMVTYLRDEGLEELSEYAATYWPRVQILNPAKSVFGAAEKITVPPSGIIAGVYARTDSARPGGVYDPPAGIQRGRLIGVLGFETDEVLEERKRDLVYPVRINPLTTGPGLPRYIDGSRTLKDGGNFPYVSERRGVIFIARSIQQGIQFARHSNNTESLRAQVRRTITAFLLTQMNNGAFRSQEPHKAFFVDVSDAINPPSEIFAGKLNIRIGLATNKPAEFIVVTLSQDTRALEAELAAAGA